MTDRILRVIRRTRTKAKPLKRGSIKHLNPSYLATAILLVSLGVAAYILGLNWPLQKSPESTSPVIYSADPTYGPVGTEITLKGSNFDSAENTVIIIPQDGMAGYISVEPKSRKSITFTFPDGLDLCPPNAEEEEIPCSLAYPQAQSGIYQLKVQTSSGISNAVTFSLLDGE